MEGKLLTVTKEFTWDMAHMLADHEGLCANLHGHTYRMQVTVARKQLPMVEEKKAVTKGMVVDFKDLKTIIEGIIVKPLDHCFMYWVGSSDSAELAIADMLTEFNKKVVAVSWRPTAENMAMDFFKVLDSYCEAEQLPWRPVSIKVWETPTSFAEVSI
jgi:6-pyruvoyltetrahydropterin/6-carboxytetrahydropterin synthase